MGLMTVFRNGISVRWDFDKLGFGIGKGRIVFMDGNCSEHGINIWINTYKRFILPYKISKYLNVQFGICQQRRQKTFQLHFTGSRVKPFTHFKIRIGMAFLGSYSPPWLITWAEKANAAHFEKMDRLHNEQSSDKYWNYKC